LSRGKTADALPVSCASDVGGLCGVGDVPVPSGVLPSTFGSCCCGPSDFASGRSLARAGLARSVRSERDELAGLAWVVRLRSPSDAVASCDEAVAMLRDEYPVSWRWRWMWWRENGSVDNDGLLQYSEGEALRAGGHDEKSAVGAVTFRSSGTSAVAHCVVSRLSLFLFRAWPSDFFSTWKPKRQKAALRATATR
jgi:hypothetical protein